MSRILTLGAKLSAFYADEKFFDFANEVCSFAPKVKGKIKKGRNKSEQHTTS